MKKGYPINKKPLLIYCRHHSFEKNRYHPIYDWCLTRMHNYIKFTFWVKGQKGVFIQESHCEWESMTLESFFFRLSESIIHLIYNKAWSFIVLLINGPMMSEWMDEWMNVVISMWKRARNKNKQKTCYHSCSHHKQTTPYELELQNFTVMWCHIYRMISSHSFSLISWIIEFPIL